MAVQYKKNVKVNYSSTNTYTTRKSDYSDNLTKAVEADGSEWTKGILGEVADGATEGAIAGASIGTLAGGQTVAGAIFGAVVGIAKGAISGLIKHGLNPDDTNQQAVYTAAKNDIDTYNSKAREEQISRNKYIDQAQYFVNSSRSNFISTYGQDTFNMLETTITTLLDMNNSTKGIESMSTLIGNLQRDSIVGDIETRLMNQSYITDSNGNEIEGGLSQNQVDSLFTSYVDISRLGSEYVKYLYENIFSSDTEIGISASDISDNQNTQLDNLDEQIKSLAISNQSKFAELFLNQRSENISNAQALGEAEAESGASGIKASKSARTSVNARKLNEDIANASYGILLNSYQKQLEANIASGILSREQIFFSTKQQIAALQVQVKKSVNESINNYVHGQAGYIKTIGEAEGEIDEWKGGAESAKQFLKDNGQNVDDSTQYIYSTHTATT